MPKRPPSPDRAPITDEWGIYDPAKAGMQALYAKLGRPVLRASAKSARQERRRSFRPERSADGVGLAIKEAMVRAGVMSAQAESAGAPVVPVPLARAVRIALKDVPPAAAPFIPAQVAPSAAKKRAPRRAKLEPPAVAQPAAAQPVAPVAVAPVAVSKPRATRKSAKARVKTEPAVAASPVVAPAVAPPVVPAPSPRRPRGPVPLAAWAHAVTETRAPEPRHADKRGFWKGIFQIPAEVALVEYARGCRIHRLLIETSDAAPMLDLL